MRRWRVRPRAAALTVLLAAGCAAGADAVVLRWIQEPDSLALLRNGEEAWRFQFGADRNQPCFHPLALPGGRVLTVDAPADHRWHHGLWFSWKLIDGVNYWEHDPRTGRPVGRTTWVVTSIDPRADGSAQIGLRLTCAPEGGGAVLVEEREIATSAPAADGGFAVDWDGTLTALTDCTLDRTPVPGEPGGRPFGGYAGLSLRLVNLADRRAETTEGTAEWNESERFRGRASGLDYNGTLAGEPVGVAILDHPANPRAPTSWYAIRSAAMTFCTPAVLAAGPLQLRAGETLRLRYRIHVHPGRWGGELLRAAAARYGVADPARPE